MRYKRLFLLPTTIFTVFVFTKCSGQTPEIVPSANKKEMMTQNDNLTETQSENKTDTAKTLKFNDVQSLKQFLYPEYHFSETALNRNNLLVKNAIEESRQKNAKVIIIEKASYTLFLVDSGKIISSYAVELGGNPYDDKLYEGDMCTPEGIYSIRRKLPENTTAYYKALLLNYPNSQDIKKGKTGSAIEIHGYGNGSRPTENGENWTLGCIALSNKDMDKLFPSVNTGDKIVIVKYQTIIKQNIEFYKGL